MVTVRPGMAKNNQGMQLLRAGDPEGALAAFDEAIEVDPEFVYAYRNRAEAFKKLGRELESRADLEKADSLIPSTLSVSTQQLLKEGEAHRARAKKLGRLPMGAFTKWGELLVGPDSISFQPDGGEPTFYIPSEDILEVAETNSDSRFFVAFRDRHLDLPKKVYFDSREPAKFRGLLLSLFGWLPGLGILATQFHQEQAQRNKDQRLSLVLRIRKICDTEARAKGS